MEGQELASLSATALAAVRRRSMGYVFQAFNLLPSLTALDNVSLPLELDGTRGGLARRAARAALEEVRPAVRPGPPGAGHPRGAARRLGRPGGLHP